MGAAASKSPAEGDRSFYTLAEESRALAEPPDTPKETDIDLIHPALEQVGAPRGPS